MPSSSAARRTKRPAKFTLVNSALLEPLETRTYFDLVPIIGGTLPATLVATVKTTAMVTVNLQNTGGGSIKGAYTIQLFASPDGQLDDAIPITAAKNEVLPTLAAGKTHPLKVAIGAFPVVPLNGNYFVLAQVGGTLAGVGDDVAASTGEIAVANPFVDLTDTIVFTSSKPGKPGQSLGLSVTVVNNGNVTAKGPIQILLGSSLNANGLPNATYPSPNVNINIAPGKHSTFHLAAKIPLGLAPDAYFATATVVPLTNAIVDSNTNNNFAVSLTTLTVLDPYPNIVTTFNGSFSDTKGPNKGTKGTISFVVTAESDTTGAITGTGNNSLGENLTFDGTITTAGVVTFNANDSENSLAYVFTGKFLRNKISGSFTGPAGDGGVFSITS